MMMMMMIIKLILIMSINQIKEHALLWFVATCKGNEKHPRVSKSCLQDRNAPS